MCALAYSTVFHGLLTLCAPALGQLVHMGEHAHLTIIVIALVSLGHGGATLRFLLSVSAVLRCACCRHTAVGCTHIRQIYICIHIYVYICIHIYVYIHT